MRIYSLKKVLDHDVEKWIEKSIPDLTPYQKQAIRDREIIRFAPFYFMEPTKKVKSIWVRLSAILLLPIFIILLAGLPFNFLFTGRWGYGENMPWYGKWVSSCGL